MEELLGHVAALERIWRHAAPPVSPASPPTAARRCFPDEGGWFWVDGTGGQSEAVIEPQTVDWLDGRFRVVEKVFRAHTLLQPRLRVAGERTEPRGVEMWEWSCIGMHRLWEGWSDPRGLVRADLRPALYDSVGDEELEVEELESFELFYPSERVEALADAFAATRRPRRLARWHRTLADVAARRGLGASSKPADLLAALVEDGLARREGRKVAVRSVDGEELLVAASTFRKTARQALSRQLFDRYV